MVVSLQQLKVNWDTVEIVPSLLVRCVGGGNNFLFVAFGHVPMATSSPFVPIGSYCFPTRTRLDYNSAS